MSTPRVFGFAAIAAALLTVPTLAMGPSFVPDWTFKGSSLTGWHVLGQADWKAQNGELVGTPKQPSGGWLVLDKSYGDIALFASFRCTGGCKTGVLLRAEKTPQGMKGVFMSLDEGALATYEVTLDAEGRETSRQKLRQAGGTVRVAPPDGGAYNPAPLNIPPGLIYTGRPTGTYKAADWNQFEIIMDANITRLFLNTGPVHLAGGATSSDTGAGPIALYVGGSGEVRYKDVSYKDLNVRNFSNDQVSGNFRKQQLHTFYYAWSAAAADFNRDGALDVVAGPYIYYGPDYQTAREIYLAFGYEPSTQYPVAAMVNFAYDFTGDGWPDVINITGSAGQGTATMFVNPKGEPRRWDKVVVVQPLAIEETILADLDADGKPEIIHGAGGGLGYSKPNPANPTGAWITRVISEPGPWGLNMSHGMGAGDVNGDRRVDVVTSWGWWEQPPSGSSQLWNYHPVRFGRWGASGGPGGGGMGVYDANGDGLADVVAALDGHGYGLAWYEQKRDAAGKTSFVEHMIMDDFTTKNAGDVLFTELHGAMSADVDGDGIQDFITGKRHMSHLNTYSDPDSMGPAVLYWYRTTRNPNAPGGAEFVPELIHNRSGVGSHLDAVDLNKDGALDILVSGANGTFIFWGKPRGR